MTGKRCAGTNRDGSTCQGYAGPSSIYCFSHDPQRAKARSAARSKGGRHNRTAHSKGQPPGQVRTMDDVLSLLDYTLSEILIGDNTISRARILIAIAAQYISAIEGGALEERLKFLEDNYGITKY